MDSLQGWLYADLAKDWIARLNESLAHIRLHLSREEVPDDFQLRDREYSSSGKTVDEFGQSRLRRRVSAAMKLVSVAAPQGPIQRSDVQVESLHPEIRRTTERLYVDGHNSQAIFEAFKAVNNRVKRLTGESADGKSLMAKAFSEERPLIAMNQGISQSDRDEQEGFKFIYMGVMQGIRNPKAHDVITETDDDRTLEYLALASLLMRRLDDAESLLGSCTMEDRDE